MNYDLVIFDCDGVLVDSEALACHVHAELLTQHGYAITADQVHDRFLGRSAREARFEVESELGRALPDSYTAQLKAAIDLAFGASLQPIAHVAETLPGLSQRICVASSGTPTRIVSSLTTTGLLSFFSPHLFSASDVANGKPAPDLFLFAAQRMQVAAERCVVIEDSIAGVTGAAAAGMTVLGFHGGSHCRPSHAAALRAAGAVASFADMRQLPAMIDQMHLKPA
ncbi:MULTISPECIES: HAD family hydrolase [Rhodopseudomonas]|uniref:Hydrolase n=1 Tax=Rhodopseudomonas palustris TaxID=1076 RepID=A0A0D7EJB2_RHOPL|nr:MULTISPECIES: HAD family hydrolase [Rhodopseudomonas]KIZ40716.1 hydrolase [Rhodopseudomonas palustris]MDF3814229.1 HAD family hydrolase [Rhodopseudomonas sp. BAL398]WOK16815.1 HAD family hydrolase [Rhodopseudomonas sp. BAL398]